MARQLCDHGRRLAHALILIAALFSVPSYAIGPGYLWQAFAGQMKLTSRTRPIVDVLKDARTPPRTRDLLTQVPLIKKYAESVGLKATRNYEDYVAWDGPAVVWVVSASRELQFESVTWSFPIVGSFSYLGWFDRDQAIAHRDEMRAEGFDADVRGAPAFSSLGYFKDPVISTMWNPDDPDAIGEFAETIIHESVHATLYIPGQSMLNESIAQYLAEQVTPGFLRAQGGDIESHYKAQNEKSEKIQLRYQRAYRDLAALYADSSRDEAAKRARKAEVLAELKQDLEKAGVHSKRELNNAVLIQYKTYRSGWFELSRLWKSCGTPQAFLQAVDKQWKAAEFADQQTDLDAALKRLTGC